MNVFWELLLVALLLAGSFFILMGGIGLVKLSEFFRRLHAPTKASTLGVGCVLTSIVRDPPGCRCPRACPGTVLPPRCPAVRG